MQRTKFQLWYSPIPSISSQISKPVTFQSAVFMIRALAVTFQKRCTSHFGETCGCTGGVTGGGGFLHFWKKLCSCFMIAIRGIIDMNLDYVGSFELNLSVKSKSSFRSLGFRSLGFRTFFVSGNLECLR